MKLRLKTWSARAGSALLTAVRWVWDQVDFEEVAITAALVLLAAGFWDWWRPGSYFAPAVVLLWVYLPVRPAAAHVESDDTKKSGRAA